jgi:hypothetical protein
MRHVHQPDALSAATSFTNLVEAGAQHDTVAGDQQDSLMQRMDTIGPVFSLRDSVRMPEP